MSLLNFNTGTFHQFTPEGGDIEGQISLNKLIDVTVSSIANNQVLKYDSAQGLWVNVDAGAITNLAIENLTNVTITSLADTQILQYNASSSQWENATNSATVTEVDGGTF